MTTKQIIDIIKIIKKENDEYFSNSEDKETFKREYCDKQRYDEDSFTAGAIWGEVWGEVRACNRILNRIAEEAKGMKKRI